MSNFRKESDCELALDSLASPEIHCPSPVVIFRAGGSNPTQLPPQAYQSPQPLQTPVVPRKDADEDQMRAALDVIGEIHDQIRQRMQMLDREMGVAPIERKPTMIFQNKLEISQNDRYQELLGSVSLYDSDFCEMDSVVREESLFISDAELASVVERKVDQEIELMASSINQTLAVEQTLWKLEQNLQVLIQTQVRSIWLK